MRVYFFLTVLGLASVDCECEDKIRKAVDDREQRTSLRDASKGISSNPTEFEPNNAPEEASPIVLKGELRAVSASIEDPADVDWFALTTERDVPEVVELTVRPRGELDVSIHVEMLKSEGMPLGYNIAKAGEAESVPSLSVPVGRPIRFAVRAEGDTSGDYTIEFVRRLAGAALEAEPNDHVASAWNLPIPGELQGGFDRPDDRDVFKLMPDGDVGEKPVFSFEYVPAANVTQVVRFFETEDFTEPLLSLQLTGSTDARGRIPNFAIPNGVEALWLVLTTVDGFDRSSSYSIRFTKLPDLAEGMELEPNDRKAQPVPVPISIKGFLHRPEDSDVFLLGVDDSAQLVDAGLGDAGSEGDSGPSAASDGRAGDEATDAGVADAGSAEVDPWAAIPEKTRMKPVLRVEFEPAREGLRAGLTWSDSDGETSFQPDEDGRVVICGRSYIPGEVELAVKPIEVPRTIGQQQTVDYRLTIREDGGQGVFEVEPNESIESADRLDRPRKGYFAEASDVDVWGFAVEPGEGLVTQRVRVHVSAGPRVSFEGRLLDNEGGLIAVMPDSAGARTLPVDLPAGVYYVELKAKSAAGCAGYDVRVETAD